MASFSNEFLQRLKDSVNILDVIGSYVELTKKGRYYFASCPFHGPETVSYTHLTLPTT